ncbi:DNA adenine methylase [Desulfolucanica intricata]|uniref:DNA adenine methylase n=1 Tax=Desulfolucanica intricata TaxID=1285191 RepID=UPI00082A7803|nr:DNA adenine methylase [Desulfolucanica intricata]
MRKNGNMSIAPIVKWVGGKRQLIHEIEKYIPQKYSTYYEPFFGGGAVLLHLLPTKAVVNDINEELINMYQVIKDNVEALIEDLGRHENSADYFYKIRALDRDNKLYKSLTSVQRASRIIYLNKTCYNGLFRVNRDGKFNTPFGRYKNPNIVNAITLKAISTYFNKNNITFRCGDFEAALNDVEKESFVYLDPPYDPVSDSASFTAYNRGGFDREEQKRLKFLCDKLNNKGIKFLLSNSATDFIKELYKDYKIKIVKAKRAVNSKGDKRGEVNEVLIRNYE